MEKLSAASELRLVFPPHDLLLKFGGLKFSSVSASSPDIKGCCSSS